MRHNLRPKMQLQDKRLPLNIDTYTDANWASCETTRKSATGFAQNLFGAAVHWQQKTSDNSTFISRIRTARNWHSSTGEPLHQQRFRGAFEARTNIRIHTDSSSAKSIAMREGTSKKAKHIQLRHLFTCQKQNRQLRRPQLAHVQHWPVRPHHNQFHTVCAVC